MDNLREIISNLDIYTNNPFHPNLEYNHYNISNNYNTNNSQLNYSPKTNQIKKEIKLNKIVEIPKKQISISFGYKPDVNHSLKNKEYIKLLQLKNRENKNKKKKEDLTISQRIKRQKVNFPMINSKVFDYDSRQERSNSSPTIKRNYKMTILPKIRNQESSNDNIIHKDFGKVPEYLEKRKEEIKEEKEQKRIADIEKTLPKGVKVLSEKERREKIEDLKERTNELEIELFQMPIVRLTRKMMERKAEIEKELNEIDNLMKRLSYKDAFIKI